MARFAIIDAGRVTNIIEADADFAASIGAIDATGAAIGDVWDGAVFTPAPPAPPKVPQSVTRRQAKQALLLNGLMGSVQPAIDAITNATQRAMIQIEWDDSQVFERQRPALIGLGTALGLNSTQLDALFVQADAL